MKRWAIVAVLMASVCSAETITFTELALANLTPITNQYSAFGILAENAYLYLDTRDTFDQMGISISDQGPAVVTFVDPANSLSIDFLVLGGVVGTYAIFDSTHTLLDSFVADATADGDVVGTHAFVGSGIKTLEFDGGIGVIALSTLEFDTDLVPVPEPSTFALMMLGLTALTVSRMRLRG